MPATSLRKQYLKIKQQYPHAIVFFRLGDFYETFDEDAAIVSRELEIILTARGMGKGQKVPMAGIPYHALDNYLSRLVNRGYKVAICEQLSPPGKGLVERDVVRVITPGTVTEPELLEAKTNNYLASIFIKNTEAGIAYIDITTSVFATTQLPENELFAELERLQPSEILVPHGFTEGERLTGTITPLDEYHFDPDTAQRVLLEHFGTATLEGYGCAHLNLASGAAGALIHYIQETQREILPQITSLTTYSTGNFMLFDIQTRRNLEIFQEGRRGESPGSLVSCLDLTRTAMGSRLLKTWLGQPLLDVNRLQQRQDAISWFYENTLPRQEIRELLARVADLERLTNRVRIGKSLPRELLALRLSLEKISQLKTVLLEASPLKGLLSEIKECSGVMEIISRAIVDEPGEVGQGNVIRKGFSSELDILQQSSQEAKQHLANIERRERQRTGVKSLKVGYNRVFGYYIEISRANLNLTPQDYIRKQTLAEAERFFTPELKEYEAVILNAQEKLAALETTIFRQVCSQIGMTGEHLLSTARATAQVDILASFAEIAVQQKYVRPTLTNQDTIEIRGGRHPVVEKAVGSSNFIANDTLLSNHDNQIIILTGPNMSGKSTYLKQTALIVLMAQIGSFVPAESATIGIVDRIFTRIGAQENLSAGQSTFMVEMVETAHILHNATSRSLIILDEIGRGTSTYDGLSIAWAVIEFIHGSPRLGTRTLFATHYHELVEISNTLPRVKNFNVAVAEEGGKVVFLHKIIPGGADRSYGIHVAQLAGMPKQVINRASEVLNGLEKADSTYKTKIPRRKEIFRQPPLFPESLALARELLQLDIDALSPLEAITKLYELKRSAREQSL